MATGNVLLLFILDGEEEYFHSVSYHELSPPVPAVGDMVTLDVNPTAEIPDRYRSFRVVRRAYEYQVRGTDHRGRPFTENHEEVTVEIFVSPLTEAADG